MITKYYYFFILGFIIFFALKSQHENIKATPKVNMLVTQYYTVKMEGETPVKDTLMECFHCNQAIVYDEKGLELEQRFYKRGIKEMYGYEKYQYNATGHKIGSKYYERDTLLIEYRYDLDEQNRIKTIRAYDAQSGQLMYGNQNQYDAKGNHYETGSLNSKEEVVDYYRRTFNNNGIALSENIEYLTDDPTFKIKYEYRPQADSNWVEQLTYYNGRLKEIRVREKVYHKNKMN